MSTSADFKDAMGHKFGVESLSNPIINLIEAKFDATHTVRDPVLSQGGLTADIGGMHIS